MVKTAQVLFILALVSGICGIAYEVLFLRMITAYLGHMIYVSAGILTIFLLALGLGSLIAYRYTRFLWLVELCIGLYALFSAHILFRYGDAIVSNLSASLFAPLPIMGIAGALIIVPALLIGFSVPIFSIYLRNIYKENNQSSSFHRSYIFYNIGAAISILALEYVLIRQYGLITSTTVIALLNATIALALAYLTWRMKASLYGYINLSTAKGEHTSLPFSSDFIALFLVAVASGIFQLKLIKIFNLAFTPAGENFALVLAAAMTGLAAGAFYSRHMKATFSRFLGIATTLLLCNFALFSLWFFMSGKIFWASINSNLLGYADLVLSAKLVLLALIGLIPFTLFGATIPALLKNKPGNQATPGQAMAITALGNAAGFLIFTLLLHQFLSNFQIAATIIALVAGAFFAVSYNLDKKDIFFRFIMLILGVGLVYASYPQNYYINQKNVQKIETIKKYDQLASFIEKKRDKIQFTVNGYLSLVFDKGKTYDKANLQETLYGLTPALYSRNQDKALVLGLGTGITVSSVMEAYSNTRTIEINPVMLDVIKRLKQRNLDLANNDQLDLRLQDAYVSLAKDQNQYDAIINTVTNPRHFAASKLFTTDFFHLVKRRLNPGGVFTMWFDARLTETGVQVIRKSAENVFRDCDYIYLSNYYTQIICSNNKLEPKPADSIKLSSKILEKYRKFNIDMPLPTLLRQIAFGHIDIDWTRKTPMNTLDRPYLEFIAAGQGAAYNYNYDFHRQMWERTTRKVLSSPGMTPEKMLKRCYAMLVLDRQSQCKNILFENAPEMEKPFIVKMLPYISRTPQRRGRIARDYIQSAIRMNKNELALEAINNLQNSQNRYCKGIGLLYLEIAAHYQKTGRLPERPIQKIAGRDRFVESAHAGNRGHSLARFIRELKQDLQQDSKLDRSLSFPDYPEAPCTLL